jgi:PKD repeat protein
MVTTETVMALSMIRRPITLYEWDFDYDGETFDVDAIGASPLYNTSTTGDHTVALRVTDAGGLADIATTTVAVQSGDPSWPPACRKIIAYHFSYPTSHLRTAS